MTDITELALITIKNQIKSFDTVVLRENEALALVEALASEKRICATWRKTAESASEKLEKAQQRIAELESRTVTVKLPESFRLAKSSSGLTYYYADEVDAALAAAGIKVEAE